MSRKTMKRNAVLQEYLDKIANGETLPFDPERIDPGPFDPAIYTARRLAEARPAFEPRPGFVRASRRRVLAQLPTARARRPRLGWRWARATGWRSPALQGVLTGLLVLMLFFSANRLASAAPAWLPGDLLYPLKPLAEDAALLTSLSSEKDAELHIEYANRRLVEIQSLALEGRYELIPTTVEGLDRHVTDALVAVSQVSGQRQETARSLARRLDHTLSSQLGVVSVLSGAAPGAARAQLHRLLLIAADGMSTVRFIIPFDSGAVNYRGAASPLTD
jgi:hypothetical protein